MGLPTQIGRYRVSARLGAGGMGVVYRALDPELAREVAVKLVRIERATFSDPHAAEARLLREGQAMARLSHPNVCRIYDVGRCPQGLYIAMELIDGLTLTQWVEAGRSWRAIVDAYVQAARGLQAAHAEGVVHRDFKPDNVMVGTDGRVRVLDFGLARAFAERFTPQEEPSSVFSFLDTQLTRDGIAIGTPRYMSPEQHLGRDVDARSDQFSLCMALHHALFGVDLFPARDIASLIRRKQEGPAEAPVPDGRAPKRLDPILRRGMSPNPGARYPTIAALLTELQRGRRRRWPIPITVAGGTALAVAIAISGDAEPQPCPAAADRLRTSVDNLLAAAHSNAPTLKGELDAFSQRWTEVHSALCEAGAPAPEPEHARELDCLVERAREVDTLALVLAEASKPDLRAVARTLQSLEPPANCLERPPTSELAEGGKPIRRALTRAKILDALGDSEASKVLATDAGTKAAALQLDDLEAEANLRRGYAERSLGELEAAQTDLSTAYFSSLRAGNDDVAAAAAVALVFHFADRSDLAEADAWARHASTVFNRGGGTPFAKVSFLNSQGRVAMERDDWKTALKLFEDALVLEGRPAAARPIRGTLLMNKGMAQANLNRLDDAVVSLEAAVIVIEDAYGPNHPQLASALLNLGSTLYLGDETDAAAETLQRALAIADTAPNIRAGLVAKLLTSLAKMRVEQGDGTEALVLFARARAHIEAQYGEFHPQLARVHLAEGAALRRQGRLDEARVSVNRAIELRRAAFGDADPRLATALAGMANVERVAGNPSAGLEPATQAVEIFEARGLEGDPDLGTVLFLLGRLHHAAGHRDEAQRVLQRALTHETQRGAPRSRISAIEAELAAIP